MTRHGEPAFDGNAPGPLLWSMTIAAARGVLGLFQSQIDADAFRRPLRLRSKETPLPFRLKSRTIAIAPDPSSVTKVGRPTPFAALPVVSDYLQVQEVSLLARPLPYVLQTFLPLPRAQRAQVPAEE
jgi:hypothetical protein